jgi:hypothetical protein
MKTALAFAVLSLLVQNTALAQDERRVLSPDGRLEFRIFVTTQPDTQLSRLAYQVRERDEKIVDTSLLGFDLLEQEPLLGENIALMSSSSASGPGFNSLILHYMQNGSLGRYLDVEVRAYNKGIAFRFVIPPSTPVTRLLIAQEATEFAVRHDPTVPLGVPFEAEEVTVTEIPVPGYPKMILESRDGGAYAVVRLVGTTSVPGVAYDGKPPFTGPWRLVLTGPKPRAASDLPGLGR